MSLGLIKYPTVDDAVDFSVKTFRLQLENEKIRLDQLAGRILAEDIRAPINIPPVDRSAVDGFAVCSESVSSASPSNPVPLILRENGEKKISCGEALPISTGEPLPEGSDAVVMLEDAEKEGQTLLVMKSVAKYENVSRKGEDFEQGNIVMNKGTPIRAWHVAALSALGFIETRVLRKLRVGIIATGSEVSEPGEGGFIFDSTSKLIAGYLNEQGYIEVRKYGIVKDDLVAIASAIKMAKDENDVILLTGGTGPSSKDLSIKALERADGKIVVRGIAMRPGRPTSIGEVEGKPVFLLSGYPVAAFVGLRFLVLPFIEKALNVSDQRLKFVFAKLTSRIFGEPGLESFIKVRFEPCGSELCAEPIMLRGSGILSSLLVVGGFLRIPKNVEGFEKGEIVRIELV